jgi:hypothetical protein
MVDLMENQPQQDQKANTKATFLWCTSCVSGVVPMDDVAVNVGTYRPFSNASPREMSWETLT